MVGFKFQDIRKKPTSNDKANRCDPSSATGFQSVSRGGEGELELNKASIRRVNHHLALLTIRHRLSLP